MRAIFGESGAAEIARLVEVVVDPGHYVMRILGIQAVGGLGRLSHYRILRHRPAIKAALEFIGHDAVGPCDAARVSMRRVN